MPLSIQKVPGENIFRVLHHHPGTGATIEIDRFSTNGDNDVNRLREIATGRLASYTAIANVYLTERYTITEPMPTPFIPLVASTAHLSRNIKLWLFANGALDFGPVSTMPSGTLPVFSVDSLTEAQEMQVAFCKLSREDNATYYFPVPAGEGTHVDIMTAVTIVLASYHEMTHRGIKGDALWAPFNHYKKALGLL